MKKKITKIILGSTGVLSIVLFLLLLPCIFIYTLFGGEISSDGYVEGNIEFAEDYLNTINKNIHLGYVSLARILYFYNEDDSLTFDEIYLKNLDENGSLKDLDTVCEESFSYMKICSEVDDNKLPNEILFKYFSKPIDFNVVTFTSFYGHERYVFDEFNIHHGWDLACSERTPVLSVGEGKVKTVRFNQDTNETDKNNSYGNYIEIEYEFDGEVYDVIYGHLYPKSNLVNVGDKVIKNQQIASVGTTGYSTGNHLHFEVRSNGKRIDGMNLIDFSL